MTLVGKIMAFFVLIFCLIAGGLMITVYVTRVNWADGYKKAQDRLQVAYADRDQYAEEARLARQEKEAAIKALQEQKDALQKALDSERAELARAKTELKNQQALVEKTNTTVSGTQSAANVRASEVDGLQKQIVLLNSEKKDLLVKLDQERGARTQAEIDKKATLNRNLELEAQLRDMAKDLLRARNGGTATVSRTRGASNPPPDNVEGRIRTLDPGSNLVTISVGSDAGLAEGHTLEVFRLGATPSQSKYLGTVEILSVRPHEAVARPVKKGLPPLQVNDRVASKIQVGG